MIEHLWKGKRRKREKRAWRDGLVVKLFLQRICSQRPPLSVTPLPEGLTPSVAIAYMRYTVIQATKSPIYII